MPARRLGLGAASCFFTFALFSSVAVWEKISSIFGSRSHFRRVVVQRTPHAPAEPGRPGAVRVGSLSEKCYIPSAAHEKNEGPYNRHYRRGGDRRGNWDFCFSRLPLPEAPSFAGQCEIGHSFCAGPQGRTGLFRPARCMSALLFVLLAAGVSLRGFRHGACGEARLGLCVPVSKERSLTGLRGL